jgi:hypothetical protein
MVLFIGGRTAMFNRLFKEFLTVLAYNQAGLEE